MNTKTYQSWTLSAGTNQHCAVDMANDDSLMFQVTCSGAMGSPLQVYFECSADGQHWSDLYVTSGNQQFDQPNYASNVWSQSTTDPELYCVTEVVGAGLRWVRGVFSVPASSSALVTVRGGVAGR